MQLYSILTIYVDDYISAKEFLETRCVVELYYGHDSNMNNFVDKFMSGNKDLISDKGRKCFNRQIQNTSNVGKDAADVQNQIENNLNSLATTSKYDMMLFFDVMNGKMAN